MTIKEQAQQLGAMIKEDAITKAYFEASENYKNDPALKNLIFEYNTQQAALGEEYKKETPDKDVISAIEKRANEIYTEITNHPTYLGYTAAQDKMNELIDTVNREITVSIFGQVAEEECTHDCSTCHGSCGHHE